MADFLPVPNGFANGPRSGPAPGANYSSEELKTLLDFARSAYDRGQYQVATRLLQEVFASGPNPPMEQLLKSALVQPGAVESVLTRAENSSAIPRDTAAALVSQFLGDFHQSLQYPKVVAPPPQWRSEVTPDTQSRAADHASRAAHALGLNDLAAAEREYRAALALAPRSADHAANLGVTLARLNRLPEAEACFRLGVALDPVSPSGHANLGTACLQQRKLGEAETAFRTALLLKPDDPDLHHHLADALCGMGRFAEARPALQEVIRLRPDHADAHLKLASAAKEQNDLPAAEAALRECLRHRPDQFDALNLLGIVLEDTGRSAEAEVTYRRATRVRPNAPEVHCNLGVALTSLGRLDEAVAAYEESLRLHPDGVPAHNNIGNTLRQLCRMADAERHLRSAIRLKPDYAEAHNNLGIVLAQQGRIEEAADLYAKALELKPLYPEAHLNRALAWLSGGDYRRGWAEYEYRWHGKAARLRDYPHAPPWDGSDPAGKTLFLHPEQGLGDTVQFLRYATLLAERGATVVAEVPPPLAELAATCPGVSRVVTSDADAGQFDAHAPYLGLPRLLGTDAVEAIPARTPYLRADPGRADRWGRELAAVGGFRVGIAWQGNPQHKGDRYRSVRLDRFEPLARIPGVTLVSLQKGFGREQIEQLNGRFPVLDLGRRTADDLADVAAAMHHLDLVVCVDTALAHLAGATHKKTWMLVSFNADWRWLRGRADTPWYPSIRLFRQLRFGEWDAVFEALESELDKTIAVQAVPITRPITVG